MILISTVFPSFVVILIFKITKLGDFTNSDCFAVDVSQFFLFYYTMQWAILRCISGPRNSLTQCRITMKFVHNFFLDPEVIFSLYTMFINAPIKEFTPTHLVTFSISRSCIRMKFYSVHSLIRLWTKCLWMNWW